MLMWVFIPIHVKHNAKSKTDVVCTIFSHFEILIMKLLKHFTLHILSTHMHIVYK